MKKCKKINLCITAGAMAILLCVLAVMPVYRTMCRRKGAVI